MDQGREFCIRLMKPWLQDDDTEMHPTHNGGESVVAETFIRTLKNKIQKYKTSVSIMCILIKSMKYNNTYHSTIKMILIDVKSNTYSDFNKANNEEDPTFEVADHVRISKYKNILSEVTLQYGLNQVI